LAPSMRKELVTVQFRSFELVMLSLMVPTTLVEDEYVLDIPNEDNKGWTLATRRRPRKQRHVQPPHSVEERVTLETRNLNALRGKRSQILVRGIKLNQSICLSKNLLSLLH